MLTVVPVALALGALTAFAQGWLPDQTASLANSVGSWSLVAFLLALAARTRPRAAASGALSLLGLVAGYYLASELRGFAASSGPVLFWCLAAVGAGPALGLSAHWVRCGRPTAAALGAGAVTGVLVGEGIHGTSAIADTTYQPYWWGQIAVGLAVLGAVAARRLRSPRPIALAAVSSAAVAATFAVIYRQDLLTLL